MINIALVLFSHYKRGHNGKTKAESVWDPCNHYLNLLAGLRVANCEYIRVNTLH